MSTLTLMKDRIAKEVRRKPYASLSSVEQDHIDNAIASAILAYQDERFFWNESRSNTFDTVAMQEFYGPDDAAAIGNMLKIDYLKLHVGNTTFDLIPDIPATIESASTNATATGQPGWFVFYNRQIRLYPIPAEVWTVRMAGTFVYGAPATDGEANNFWMTTAERLIRSRAKYELALHVLRDVELAQTMSAATTEAFAQIKRWTNRLTQRGDGRVQPMHF